MGKRVQSLDKAFKIAFHLLLGYKESVSCLCLLADYFCLLFYMLSVDQRGLLDLVSSFPFTARWFK